MHDDDDDDTNFDVLDRLPDQFDFHIRRPGVEVPPPYVVDVPDPPDPTDATTAAIIDGPAEPPPASR